MKSANSSKSFWTRQYKEYKKAIKENTPLIELLPSHPYVIKFISGPTKEQQLAAVLSDARVMKYIKGVDHYVAIRAIKVLPWVIKYVVNPTEEMWLHALTHDPNLIFKSPKITWPMFETVFGKVKRLNSHKGLLPEMRTAIILVS
ncbi:MAG: hypothetical protein M0R77_10610 [Gammaproteobacteria bacterium]|nr:hypothetical protein [Gammaproteobacteria bacterium]